MEAKSNKPNMFFVGAPKCGTTALVEYLRDHKDIFISEPKEPNFFMDDSPSMKYIDDLQGYKSLYSDKLVNNCKVVADASILYMYSKEALSNIKKYNPDAKIVAMIRNPVEMVQSFHLQLLYNLDEDEPDFSIAWDLIAERKAGNKLPQKYRDTKLLFYSDIGKYYEQLKRVYDLFSKEQIKVILYDDFVKSNLDVYKDTLKFLRVPYDGKESFDRINDAKKPKSKFVNKIVQRPPAFLIPIAKTVRKITGNPRLGILEFLDKLNRDKVDKKNITDELEQCLKTYFREDIKKTSRLIDRDLSKWL